MFFCCLLIAIQRLVIALELGRCLGFSLRKVILYNYISHSARSDAELQPLGMAIPREASRSGGCGDAEIRDAKGATHRFGSDLAYRMAIACRSASVPVSAASKGSFRRGLTP